MIYKIFAHKCLTLHVSTVALLYRTMKLCVDYHGKLGYSIWHQVLFIPVAALSDKCMFNNSWQWKGLWGGITAGSNITAATGSNGVNRKCHKTAKHTLEFAWMVVDEMRSTPSLPAPQSSICLLQYQCQVSWWSRATFIAVTVKDHFIPLWEINWAFNASFFISAHFFEMDFYMHIQAAWLCGNLLIVSV